MDDADDNEDTLPGHGHPSLELLCRACFPADCEEATLGLVTPRKCDRCGVVIDPSTDEYHYLRRTTRILVPNDMR
jgi:hypothetical protein